MRYGSNQPLFHIFLNILFVYLFIIYDLRPAPWDGADTDNEVKNLRLDRTWAYGETC